MLVAYSATIIDIAFISWFVTLFANLYLHLLLDPRIANYNPRFDHNWTPLILGCIAKSFGVAAVVGVAVWAMWRVTP